MFVPYMCSYGSWTRKLCQVEILQLDVEGVEEHLLPLVCYDTQVLLASGVSRCVQVRHQLTHGSSWLCSILGKLDNSDDSQTDIALHCLTTHVGALVSTDDQKLIGCATLSLANWVVLLQVCLCCPCGTEQASMGISHFGWDSSHRFVRSTPSRGHIRP